MTPDPADEVSLREVRPADVAVFYEHQADPEGGRMAAFTARDRQAHFAHWERILRDESVILRTVVCDGEVVGNVSSWVADGRRLVGYWIGRDHWGRGIATRALRRFLGLVEERPLRAFVAKHNAGSIRVLEKCGFAVEEERIDDEGLPELVMRLDLEFATTRAAAEPSLGADPSDSLSPRSRSRRRCRSVGLPDDQYVEEAIDHHETRRAEMPTDTAHRPTAFTKPSDRELVATRTFDAPRELVFDCHTSPEHIPHWMLGPEGWTMPVCEVDLRPGGAWHHVWRRADGTEMELNGTYREIERPGRLVHTEAWGGDWPETRNTLVLTEEDGTTTLTCTVLYPSEEARDKALATGMTEGWTRSYELLDDYLAQLGRPR